MYGDAAQPGPGIESEAVRLLPIIARSVARACGLGSALEGDLVSAAYTRLFQGGSALLGFRGESSLKTYLTVVVSRLAVDEAIGDSGRWRPSAEARHFGPAAEEFERLIARDRLDRESAIALILERHPGVTRGHLERWMVSLPFRPPRLFVTEDEAASVADARSPEAIALDKKRLEDWNQARSLLRDAVEELGAQDRSILRLRFEQGMKIVEIARLFSIEQRILYRRIDSILTNLRRALERRGLSDSAVADLLAGDLPEDA